MYFICLKTFYCRGNIGKRMLPQQETNTWASWGAVTFAGNNMTSLFAPVVQNCSTGGEPISKCVFPLQGKKKKNNEELNQQALRNWSCRGGLSGRRPRAWQQPIAHQNGNPSAPHGTSAHVCLRNRDRCYGQKSQTWRHKMTHEESQNGIWKGDKGQEANKGLHEIKQKETWAKMWGGRGDVRGNTGGHAKGAVSTCTKRCLQSEGRTRKRGVEGTLLGTWVEVLSLKEVVLEKVPLRDCGMRATQAGAGIPWRSVAHGGTAWGQGHACGSVAGGWSMPGWGCPCVLQRDCARVGTLWGTAGYGGLGRVAVRSKEQWWER